MPGFNIVRFKDKDVALMQSTTESESVGTNVTSSGECDIIIIM